MDQQLTGREMLALHDHFSGCVSCEREMQSIRQVKALLRGLREPGPPRGFSSAVAMRLEQAEAQPWWVLVPSLTLPQCGRRLAGALVLSCVTVVSFALPFAPEAQQAARSSSAVFGTSLGAGSSAFGLPAEPDVLLSGRVPERVTLIPASDLTHFSPAEPPAPSAGALSLAGTNTPPLQTSLDAASHEAAFGPIQFADVRSR